MPVGFGGQKEESLLKRAEGTKSYTIMAGNGKTDSPQFILKIIKESDFSRNSSTTN